MYVYETTIYYKTTNEPIPILRQLFLKENDAQDYGKSFLKANDLEYCVDKVKVNKKVFIEKKD